MTFHVSHITCIDNFTVEHSHDHLCCCDLIRSDGARCAVKQVAVEDEQVGASARANAADLRIPTGSFGCAQCVSKDNLSERKTLVRVPGRGLHPFNPLATEGSVEAEKRVHVGDGCIATKRKQSTALQQRAKAV